MHINWNSNFVNTILAVILGSLLTIGINYLNDYRLNNIKKKRALKILLVEFEKIKSVTPGLLNSFNDNLDIIIQVKISQLPFSSGSFQILNEDLLSLKFEDYKKVYEFYSKVETFQIEYEKMLSAQTNPEKSVYGLMVRDSLIDIANKLNEVEKDPKKLT